jgi:nucleoside-diphosphate-sugar epimerase
MRVLFTGGTGNISTACTHEALKRDMEVFHLNRGNHADAVPKGVNTLKGDGKNPDDVRKAVRGLRFDSVVQFLGYFPNQVEADIDIFSGATDQYMFISSASAYLKPMAYPVVTESSQLGNPYWEYSQNKAISEQLIERAGRERGFPWTVVRPAHTYSDVMLPTNFGQRDYTIPQRILDGREIIVHGDGQSIWPLTHASDLAVGLVGLLGNPAAIGQAFHITSDEVLTWDSIFETYGMALGRKPNIVHIPSEYIGAMNPTYAAPMMGERRWSTIFDNSKIKRLVPAFHAVIPFAQGIRGALAWFDAHPAAKVIDKAADAEFDRILASWHKGFPAKS